MPATIEDESVLDRVKENCISYGKGMGQYCNLDFGNKDIYIEEWINYINLTDERESQTNCTK